MRIPVRTLVVVVGFALASSALAGSRQPISFSARVRPPAGVDLKVMPPVDLYRLQAEDAVRPVPYRFAEAIPVGYTTENAGTWDDLPDGGRVWRLRIASSGAQSLNLGFTRFDLPEGASLWLYSEAQDQVEGPYTASDRTSDGQLWTPIILGEALVVEVHVPRESRGAATVEVGFVNHGYRGFEEAEGKAHGACHYDVICAEGNPWRPQIRAVAWYTLSGVNTCSGTLMNNTAQDFKPYFLTANHCGITAGTAGTIVTYWNYEAPLCGQQDGGSLTENQTGATLRAAHAPCDLALIELSKIPPFDVYYSGWDRSGLTPQSGVGIHHPDLHVKSISLDDDPLTSYDLVTPALPANCTNLPTPPGAHTHWRVGTWNKGSTEGGSSGSCIWDPSDGRCFGFLTCGDADCNGANPNAGSDYYGKMSCAWTGGGTAATRLSDWLDPLTTGDLFWDGLEPPTKCASEKIKAAGKKASCKAGLEANQASKGGTIDPAKVAKCEAKLSTTFAKNEAKGSCKTTGDAAAIEAKVDAFVADVDTELAVGTLPNKCQGEKIKAAGKKAQCKLNLESKQAKKGGTIDPAKVAKCESKLSSTFAKQETGGACNTTGDAAAIEAKVDAFVTDVDSELVGSSSGAFLK